MRKIFEKKFNKLIAAISRDWVFGAWPRLRQTFYLRRSGKTVRQVRSWLGSNAKSWSREMWFCRKSSSQSRSCREGRRESLMIEGWNRTCKAASGNKKPNLMNQDKGKLSLDIRLSDESRAWESETTTATEMKRGVSLFISHRSSSVLKKCNLRVLVNLTQPVLQKVGILGS